MATTPPTISDGCFSGCSIDKAKLMVPKASVSSYKSAAVWKSFGTIVSVDGEEVAGECEKPSISYVSGNLMFGCQTPGAEYHYTINPNRSLEKVSCHFLMTAIRKTALYMLDL